MILDSGKTVVLHIAVGHAFESVVILDSGKTLPVGFRWSTSFESVVILDSGKTTNRYPK